jgi:hypothetical protein
MKKRFFVVSLCVLYLCFSLTGKDIQTVKTIQLGLGVNIGVFNPTDYRQYLKKFANNNGLQILGADSHSQYLVNYGLSAYAGYATGKHVSLSLIGEIAETESSTSSFNPTSFSYHFYLRNIAVGPLINYTISISQKIDGTISGGIIYNYLYMKEEEKKSYSGTAIGFRLLCGADYYPVKWLFFRGLIGYNMAKDRDKGLKLDYSGIRIETKIIFNILKIK